MVLPTDACFSSSGACARPGAGAIDNAGAPCGRSYGQNIAYIKIYKRARLSRRVPDPTLTYRSGRWLLLRQNSESESTRWRCDLCATQYNWRCRVVWARTLEPLTVSLERVSVVVTSRVSLLLGRFLNKYGKRRCRNLVCRPAPCGGDHEARPRGDLSLYLFISYLLNPRVNGVRRGRATWIIKFTVFVHCEVVAVFYEYLQTMRRNVFMIKQ
ncbi:hypothetical protein EVAR_97359_1 [Eumeta japonica]|uniref:Uncharacterized protein n=1 Tax=Eumeta variegata TaxID=151549 RepID=A0A4C1Z0N8_EUMVA|nr:hypothetical protein EVAR_97359_1 [Eumeta japonica]